MNAYTIAEAESQLARLVDQALAGELVTIMRDGKPAVTPHPAVLRPMTPEDVEELRRSAERRPQLPKDSVSLIRQMRDEFT